MQHDKEVVYIYIVFRGTIALYCLFFLSKKIEERGRGNCKSYGSANNVQC
jgi:hypothetical protein